MRRSHSAAVGLLVTLPLTTLAAAQNVAPALRMFGPMTGTDTWLVDTNGATIHTWPSSFQPGLATYLLSDGVLLRTINTDPTAGESPGGGIQKLTLDGTVLWDFRYDSGGVLSHHDIAPMPNGNVLMIAWETKTRAEAIAAGRNPALLGASFFRPDHVIEVQPTGPTSGDIVWEWHIWDHVIQDFSRARANYGAVGEVPRLLDINYPPNAAQGKDWNHLNGIDYDPVHDWIVLSAKHQNEIWIIDHSTTTAEAAGHTGGDYGMGGDLIYRWGNAAAYRQGSSAGQRLFGQHAAHFIPEGYPGAGNILLFNNGPPGGSAAEEIELPLDGQSRFVRTTGEPFGPVAPLWSHSGGFQSTIMSSAARAPNGNTLICSGEEGRIFEVTPAGQEVWSETLGTRVFHAHYVDRRLWSDRTTLTLTTGGAVTFDLIAGSEHADDVYLVLGSASGTNPGVPLLGKTLPLNLDSYLSSTLTTPNRFPFGSTLGNLDALGRGLATFTLPPGFTVLAGLHLDHTFVVVDPLTSELTLVGNTVPLDLRR